MFLRTLILLILAAAAQPAAAQVVQGETSGDWTKGCLQPRKDRPNAPEQCFVFQRLFPPGSEQAAATVAVGRPGPGKPLLASLTVPLGVNLPQGITVWVEGDEKAVRRPPLLFCVNAGCEANMRMDDVMMKAFKLHLNAALSFTMVDGRQITLPISLRGFTHALTFLE